MTNRYAFPMKPNNRVQEIDEEVLKESGATDAQIDAFKASVNTTQDEKLAAAGIDVEKVKNISRARYDGTFQGGRNLLPQGEYSKYPEFVRSYKIANAKWLSQTPSERPVFLNSGKVKYEYVSGNKEVSEMYKAGAEHAATGKILLNSTRKQQANKDFKRGYMDIIDNLDMEAGAPDSPAAARGSPTTRSTGTGTPTLANKLPSPQKPVGNLIDTFEAYARGLGNP